MPFSNMLKAFGGPYSRNRNHHPPDHVAYDQGFSRSEYHQPIPPPQPPQLRRHETLTRRRMEPVFTPVPSRAPTEGDEYFDGYVRVDNPQTVLGGALNARPTRPENPSSPVPSVERDDGGSRYSDTFSEHGHIPNHSRLPDQPPSFPHHMQTAPPRAESFHHGSVSGHRLPDGPDITHISRSNDDSGSDHTIEGPRTSIPSHSHARAASLHPSGGYVGKTPTNIYADGGHEIRPMRHEGIYPANRPPHSGGQGPVYYIIPGGMSVIFQDEYGNEVARVGDFTGRSTPHPAPHIMQDKHGRELYSRYEGFDHERSHRHREPRVASMDTNQYSSRRPSSSRSYSSQSYYTPPSHTHRDDYYHEHRDRGYRDRDHRDHNRDREYRDKEYRDKEYRDREYRARDHRDRHHRDRDYGRRDDWRPEDRSRGPHPSMHRSNSSGHIPSSRHEMPYPHSLPDDRQSNSSRMHDVPHPLDMHHQVEEIGDGLQSLQI